MLFNQEIQYTFNGQSYNATVGFDKDWEGKWFYSVSSVSIDGESIGDWITEKEYDLYMPEHKKAFLAAHKEVAAQAVDYMYDEEDELYVLDDNTCSQWETQKANNRIFNTLY